MNKNSITFGFLAGFAALLLSAPASAAKSADQHACFSQVELPQDKEELDLSDVKHAVNSHLLRIGAAKQDVWVKWIEDEIILASIVYQGRVLRQIEVDAANAAIIERRNYVRPVGFEAPKNRPSVQTDQFVKKVRYTRELRRHMLGDGQEWANWVGDRKSGVCFDDYRFGGPTMDEPTS